MKIYKVSCFNKDDKLFASISNVVRYLKPKIGEIDHHTLQPKNIVMVDDDRLIIESEFYGDYDRDTYHIDEVTVIDNN